MIDFIKRWLDNRREQKRILNESCDQFVSKIESLCAENSMLFQPLTEFVEPNKGVAWEKRGASLISEVSATQSRKFRKTTNYYKLTTSLAKLQELVRTNQQRIRQHNDNVARQRIQAAYNSIGDVEGRRLDEQQMGCIVKKAHSHLVIAGAGTGKTTTVVGKIKYLLRSNQCQPEDILVLSFTNASASEMSQRINAETGAKIQASTFHKLGLNIIAKVNGIMPRISQLNMRGFVKEQLQTNMESDAYLALLSEYLLFHRGNSIIHIGM